MNDQAPRASFRSMDEGTPQDWAVIGSQFMAYAAELPGCAVRRQPGPPLHGAETTPWRCRS